MSLDNFVTSKPKKKTTGPIKSKKTSKKKKETAKPKENIKISSEQVVTGRTKFKLSCTAACKYTRVLKKRELRPEDYICPKCGKKMKSTIS